MSVANILKAIVTTMKAEPYCFLITLNESGQPSARMVEAAEIDDNLTVWVITDPESKKVKEIERDNRTTMAFSDNKGEGYATLTGLSNIVNDHVRKKGLWKLNYEAFFPEDLKETTPSSSSSFRIEWRLCTST